jgi:hypothetical protein
MALAIFKVGSHVGLLQALDDYSPEITDMKSALAKTIEKLHHIGNQKYYSICSLNGATSQTTNNLNLIFNIDELKHNL